MVLRAFAEGRVLLWADLGPLVRTCRGRSHGWSACSRFFCSGFLGSPCLIVKRFLLEWLIDRYTACHTSPCVWTTYLLTYSRGPQEGGGVCESNMIALSGEAALFIPGYEWYLGHFDRLISGYRLTQTALSGDPHRRTVCMQSSAVSTLRSHGVCLYPHG